MLSKFDDYPIHQTPEPIAHPVTGDRNFYDRYFFNGFSRDGELFFAAAIGLYLSTSQARDGVGKWALWGLLGLTGILWATQPWAPPPPSAGAVAVSALVLWILIPWAHWVEKHREAVPAS